jgi:hypothetical protein
VVIADAGRLTFPEADPDNVATQDTAASASPNVVDNATPSQLESELSERSSSPVFETANMVRARMFSQMHNGLCRAGY